tara:strand:+ start:507 stop:1283 length:777 start_codon:yes stop_codon:yes gene_type:complete
MSYFKYFPTTVVNGVEALDITRRAKINKLVKDSALSYMSYTVEDGDRPEDVAYYYYDDPSLAWLVLMSNDVVDPYSEWPKSFKDLDNYIVSQYEERSGKTDAQSVIEWTKNRTIGANIVRYQSQNDPDISINRASFVSLADSHKITVDKIVAGEEYTIKTLGQVANSSWRILAGTSESSIVYQVGDIFTATQDGTTIVNGSSAVVMGASITNPAREYYAVRIYDHEVELNEAKREIQLINKGYLSTIKDQLSELLNDV